VNSTKRDILSCSHEYYSLKGNTWSPGEQVRDFVFGGGLIKLPSATKVGDAGLVAWMRNPLKLSAEFMAASLTVICPPGSTLVCKYIHRINYELDMVVLCGCKKTWTSKQKVHPAVKIHPHLGIFTLSGVVVKGEGEVWAFGPCWK
jgi:hypothetical protein